MPFTTVSVLSYVQHERQNSVRMKSGEMSGRRWRSSGGEGTERKERKVGGRLRVYYAGGRYN